MFRVAATQPVGAALRELYPEPVRYRQETIDVEFFDGLGLSTVVTVATGWSEHHDLESADFYEMLPEHLHVPEIGHVTKSPPPSQWKTNNQTVEIFAASSWLPDGDSLLTPARLADLVATFASFWPTSERFVIGLSEHAVHLMKQTGPPSLTPPYDFEKFLSSYGDLVVWSGFTLPVQFQPVQTSTTYKVTGTGITSTEFKMGVEGV